MPVKQYVAAKVAIWKEGKLLVILEPRHGNWGLPGGRIDPGEHPKDCLKREIEEEIGKNELDFSKMPIGIFPVISPHDGDGYFILVYEAYLKGDILLSDESEADEVKFVSLEEFDELSFSDLHKEYTRQLFTNSTSPSE